MPAVCAGYFRGDLLFEVQGLRGDPTPVQSFVANTFSALTRGAPTAPSPKILELLIPSRKNRLLEWKAISQEPLYLIGEKRRAWDRTIRGAPDGYNPALEFFEAILPTQLQAWGFIQQLIIPEYPLFRRLGASANLISSENDERVDFFLPQADLVIEIDGGSHRTTRQAWKDAARDRFLEQFGILTLRIDTKDLRAENEIFRTFFDKLRLRCEEAPRLKPYREFIAHRKYARTSLRYELTAAIRLQIALILAISHNQLDLDQAEWRLSVAQDFESEPRSNWITSAVDELFDWFELFARLGHKNFAPPKLVLDENGLHFDMRLFSRADDDTSRTRDIVVCTSAVQDLPFPIDDGRTSTIARVADLGVSYLAAGTEQHASHEPPNVADLTELCRRIFGHDSFRPGQESLILNALSGQKSLGLMPTGGGKSLCFQLPALMKTGTTIVVVPIKALGRDHCAELEAAGFSGRVVNIDSDMPAALRERIYTGRILRGDMRFVFVSPERFQSLSFRDTIRGLHQNGQLRMFVIDEVHCMSEWGHDFRPSYLTLPGTLRELADDVPVLGLTATASVNVLRDIQGEFHITDELVAYEMHRSRSELNFSIVKDLSAPEKIEAKVVEIVADSEGNLPPPIHVFSRYANGVMGVETYATMLANSRLGLRVGSFSGSTPDNFSPQAAYKRLHNPEAPEPKTYEDYKKTVQELWKSGQLDVMVTTKAFGMGVNKPDVRHTLHAGMPSSMEAFYQEAGRAGRDRGAAFCHMLLRPEPDDAEIIFTRLRDELTPESISEALDRTSDGGVLKRNSRGDFRAQLWFLSQGLISIEEEQALVARLHDVLKKHAGEIVSLRTNQIADLRHGAQRLQLTLYRLYQMGLVAPWAVTDWGRGDGENAYVQAVEVRKLPVDFKGACEAVAVRVQAIDGKSANLSALEDLVASSSERENWPALYHLLLSWVRRKHLDSRLQSTWNLYSKSMAFTPGSATAFRDDLEAFFKIDSDAFQLASLRDMPQDEVLAALGDLLRGPGVGQIKERAALRKLYTQLSRLLEGTQDSPGLNLAAASLLLLTEETAGPEARQRLRAAVPNGALSLWSDAQGRRLLGLIASSGATVREIVGQWLVEELPKRDQLLSIYDLIPAHAVEAALFDALAADLAEAV